MNAQSPAPPTKCNGDDMYCNGGKDPRGCPNPDFCIPSKGGPVGIDGYECPVTCPMKCDDSMEMPCYGGKDSNGCPNSDFCMPSKGGPVGIDGNECPVTCPMQCDASFEMPCYGGKDPNGCPHP